MLCCVHVEQYINTRCCGPQLHGCLLSARSCLLHSSTICEAKHSSSTRAMWPRHYYAANPAVVLATTRDPASGGRPAWLARNPHAVKPFSLGHKMHGTLQGYKTAFICPREQSMHAAHVPCSPGIITQPTQPWCKCSLATTGDPALGGRPAWLARNPHAVKPFSLGHNMHGTLQDCTTAFICPLEHMSVTCALRWAEQLT
jgi:hypothetical protein